VAQTINAVLLYRAEQQRREAGLLNSLAFQLVADPRIDYRGFEGKQPLGEAPGRGWLRLRIERAATSPIVPGELRDAEREAGLRAVLDDQGIEVDELVVFTRPIRNDAYIMRGVRARPRWRGEGRWDPEDDMLVAGLRREGDRQWHIARQPLPDGGPRRLGPLIIQTLVIYVVLVGGLAFLLRRITRPLAALTRRVEEFAETRATDNQVVPTGPADMRRLISAHNAMEARIAALINEKDVMLGAIGHDLKTPLAALRVRIESVEDEGERGKMAASIEDITRSLDDILSLARVGRPTDPLERTDLAALAAQVVEEYEDMGDPVELGETQRVALPLRATWMRRAIRNLVGNALRYGERATVSVLRDDGSVVVRIEDEGAGIAEHEIARMLEPFVRGEASRNRETGGAGLGLTLARAIAEQHGGSLVLANRHAADGAVTGLVAELRLPVRG
jgi:signal transduction histidine kinase